MTPSAPSIQAWIKSRRFDIPYILLPPFVSLLVVLLLPAQFRHTADMPVAVWCVLLLCVDVAHVYSTLFTTYLDKARLGRHKALFLWAPVACYVAGALLYAAGALVFWRCLAYLAVFHFVRQQYGFMRRYSIAEAQHPAGKVLDTLTIYAATIYPLAYWHLTPGRNFNWFVDGDFFTFHADTVKQISGWVYTVLLATYAVKEAYRGVMRKFVNIPKNLVVAGTALSWYFGIVVYNGDVAFTLLNVVSHGIPYMSLIRAAPPKPAGIKPAGSRTIRYSLWAFLGIIIGAAYLEEGLWDGFIWRDHPAVFALFSGLPVLAGNPTALIFLVPLLSLPQSTHYVLDGFIWRRRFG